MKKEMAVAAIASLVTVGVHAGSGNPSAGTPLDGIDCSLMPNSSAERFSWPVRSTKGGAWINSNEFGNVVKARDLKIRAAPDSLWQHTGADFLLNGSSAASEGQPIFAAANGVVVFSTSSQPNPLRRRGGLVIIRHIPPPGYAYAVPQPAKSFSLPSETSTIFRETLMSSELVSYYLHLDPKSIKVMKGDQVKAGSEIAKLYRSGSSEFTYPPHLHFEIWVKCLGSERNGYDRAGSGDFEYVVGAPNVDPVPILEGQVKLDGFYPRFKDFEVSWVTLMSRYPNVVDYLGEIDGVVVRWNWASGEGCKDDWSGAVKYCAWGSAARLALRRNDGVEIAVHMFQANIFAQGIPLSNDSVCVGRDNSGSAVERCLAEGMVKYLKPGTPVRVRTTCGRGGCRADRIEIQ